MTIKAFRNFLDTYCEGAVEEKPISSFAGKRLAIDGNNWFHIYMATAHKNVVYSSDLRDPNVSVDHQVVVKHWIKEIVKLMGKFLEIGITPLFIIDGPGRKLKWETQESRRETKKKTEEKIEAVLEKMKAFPDIRDIPKALVNERKKYEATNYRIEKGDLESLRDCLYACGIPCLRAVHDAEELCCNLAREGKTAAVLSADYDTLCFGTPFQIRKIGTIKDGGASGLSGKAAEGMPLDAMCEVVSLNKILSKVGWSHDKLRDYCLFCGCDFQPGKTKGIKGIGAKKAYALMKKHGYLEAIIQHLELSGKDTSVLNHEECREIFSTKDSSTLCLREEDCPADEYDLNNLQVSKATSMEEMQIRLDIMDMYEIRKEYNDHIKERIKKVSPATDAEHAPIYDPPKNINHDKPLLEVCDFLREQPRRYPKQIKGK